MVKTTTMLWVVAHPWEVPVLRKDANLLLNKLKNTLSSSSVWVIPSETVLQDKPIIKSRKLDQTHKATELKAQGKVRGIKFLALVAPSQHKEERLHQSKLSKCMQA